MEQSFGQEPIFPNIDQSSVKKSPNWKFILLIILVGLIGASAYGAYYFFSKQEIAQVPMVTNTPIISPSSIPTPLSSLNDIPKGWKTYINNQYNYEIRYPGNWFYQKLSNGGVLFSDVDLDNFSGSPGHNYPDRFINFSFYKTTETIDQYSENDLRAKKAEVQSKNEILIYGGRMLVFKSKIEDKIYLSAYIKIGGSIGIFESYISNSDDVTDIKKIFDIMVSNFKI